MNEMHPCPKWLIISWKEYTFDNLLVDFSPKRFAFLKHAVSFKKTLRWSTDRSVEDSHANYVQYSTSAQCALTCLSKGKYSGRKPSVQIGCKENGVKGKVNGLRGSKGPGCELKREQEEASALIDAGCLLFASETVERQSALKWINYYSLLT